MSNRRTDGVGNGKVIGLDNLRSAGHRALNQDAAAADNDDRHGNGAGLHTVYCDIDHLFNFVFNGTDERFIQTGNGALVTNVHMTSSNTNVRGGERITAKNFGLGCQFIADTLRTDAHRPTIGCWADQRPAAETNRERIRHTEVGAYATDADRQRRHPWETVLQDADIGGRAADIDDNGVL